MKRGKVATQIVNQLNKGYGCYWILLDPDDFSSDHAAEIASSAQNAGVDAILVGGSLLNTNHLNSFVKSIKSTVTIPVILFPGDATQISPIADAILFLSLVSGRNPVNLIGEQVKGAPAIKEYGIEPISTAYMLVESGAVTSVEFMSNTRPLPRSKPMIAAAHGLAAQYMGMNMIYLEAGSGAPKPVPSEMIRKVCDFVDIPIIVGGGIRGVETAVEKIKAGADIIVTGNLLHDNKGVDVMKQIAGAVKTQKRQRDHKFP